MTKPVSGTIPDKQVLLNNDNYWRLKIHLQKEFVLYGNSVENWVIILLLEQILERKLQSFDMMRDGSETYF